MQALPDFDELSDDALARMIETLVEQETRISYERRVLQGTIDVLVAELTPLVWHVARNAMIPFVTIMIPEIPNILTGSIFIEQIFRVPGLGRFFVTSTLTRDYPMILALVLLVAVVWGITYLFTDILYTLLDPRIRLI